MFISKDTLIVLFLRAVLVLTDWEEPILVELAQCVRVGFLDEVWFLSLIGAGKGSEIEAVRWARWELTVTGGLK